MEKTTNQRVRMNLSQTAKGSWQADITVEFDTVAECEKEMGAAIKAAKRVMEANGLKEAAA